MNALVFFDAVLFDADADGYLVFEYEAEQKRLPTVPRGMAVTAYGFQTDIQTWFDEREVGHRGESLELGHRQGCVGDVFAPGVQRRPGFDEEIL